MFAQQAIGVVCVMSACPNCKGRLTILDWRPVCPHCGVNLTFFNFEERFYNDAKLTELGFAKVRVQTARFKGLYIGSSLAILRLVVCLLPALALLVPVANVSFALPMVQESYAVGALGVYGLIANGALSYLLQLMQSELVGGVFSLFAYAIAALLATAVFAVLGAVFTLLVFFSKKVSTVGAVVFSCLGIAGAVTSLVLSSRFLSAAAAMPGIITASLGVGAYVLIAAFVAVIVMNLLFARKEVAIPYREGDLYRVDIAKKLKRKEITLAEIDFPIYETQEEREQRLKLEAEEQAKEAAANE